MLPEVSQNPSRPGAAVMAPISPEYSPLTLENLTRLQIAPPNLEAYLSTPQDFEKVLVGKMTCKTGMVDVLRAWDRQWEKAARNS
ncbi:hypothetical protein ONS95_014657 [Cadophora gregata]|uniref:uncharacterized protein n=1 Tax=Cadophora gregata TaxID=51156 RepID=UPI0026DB97FB|nr:uncharacterized protein ONS95_014657 [Cadophora gregata]KAK0112939.1 hypothetical protein ONS95_014657 [Cadophora gregata]KAK0125063.1 hypothetical protein ONS96_008931 [Cadophora gregata f. sp. sojae]